MRKYLWLDDMPIAVLTNDAGTLQTLPVHADHLNTPRAVMDLDNAMRWSWTDPSDVFGKESAANNPLGLGAVSFNLRFAGQVYDRESGMHYNVNRDYVSGMGRYAQSDPIELEGGINTYGYVEGNPLSFTDLLRLMGQGSGGNAKGPRAATPGGANASVGAGFSGHTPFGFGIGIDGGIARDTTGNTCFYSNICYTVGPGTSASIGAVGSVGSGPLSSGTTEYNGACWSGGAGVGGSGSVLFGKDGSAQMGRGLYGPSAGGSATYQSCRLQLICARN